MDAICIVNNHAEILFFAKFDADVTKTIFDKFITLLISNSCYDPPPHVVIGEQEYVYVLREELYWCCCYKKGSILSNCGPLFQVDNLSRFHRLCVGFIGVITQYTITANLILLQEIVLETMCGGFMQIQDIEKLQSQIYSKVKAPKETSALTISPGLFGLEKSAPTTASRKSILTLESGKKEVFVDVYENISAIVSAEGVILRSEVKGSVDLHCLLLQSSSVSVSLTLNSNMSVTPSEGFHTQITFAEVEYGSGVDTSLLATKRELKIGLKPGESHILRYSQPPGLSYILPFELTAIHTQQTQSDMEVKLKLTSKTGMGTTAPRVVVNMPAPPSTTTIMSRTNGPRNQNIAFSSSDNSITWTISDFPGGSYAQAFIRLVDAGDGNKIERANLDFEVSKWVSSGLRVEKLKLHPPVPDVQTWVRYMSTSDTVNFRFT